MAEKLYFFRKAPLGGYSIRRREPKASNGYVHLWFVPTLAAARHEVSLLNAAGLA